MATLPHDDIYQLVREPIDIAALARSVRAPEDGAIVTFDGFVRNQSHNRASLYLDYEAYESMALAKMHEWVQSPNLRRHIETVEHVMRRAAPRYGGTDADAEQWAVGISSVEGQLLSS